MSLAYRKSGGRMQVVKSSRTDSQEQYEAGLSDATHHKMKAAYALYEGPSSGYNRGYKAGLASVVKLIRAHKLHVYVKEMGLPVTPDSIKMAERYI